jgi:DNA-binding NarL/FixJ family response regulator
MPLRVIVADDDYLVRSGITALLRELTDVDVVGTVSGIDALFMAVEEHHPDVVLTDIRMPPRWDDEGIAAARRIRREHPGIGVVVLSQHAEAAYAMALLERGVDGLGYLLKERVGDPADLLNALVTVAAGGSVIDPKVVQELVNRRSTAESSPISRLTERETDVLREMATGKNNAAVARALFLSERAVEKHINAVFAKLGLSEEGDVNRRVMAVLTFLDRDDTGIKRVGSRAVQDTAGGEGVLASPDAGGSAGYSGNSRRRRLVV